MSEEVHESPQGEENYMKVGVIAVIAVVILTGITIAAYQYAKKRSSATVLPGGTTYLGPGDTEQPAAPPAAAPSKFTADEGVAWSTFRGKTHPYSFDYPATMPTVVFPNDVTDSIAISWNNIPPQNNIIARVISIRETEPQMVEFIGRPMEYVKNWWKQWGGLKGVKSVEEFTNSKGLVGYRAKFINSADDTPNEDVFFPNPANSNLMVRFGNGPIDKTVFDKMLDTFSWSTASGSAAARQPTVAPTAAVSE